VKSTKTSVVLFLSVLVTASCGGGGGGGNSPPPSTGINTALVASGSVIAGVEIIPNASRVISTQAELDQFVGRAGALNVPAEYRSVNFTLNSVLYVEGGGDNDPSSSVRIVDAETVNGVNMVSTEICGIPASNPSGHRPFAMYIVPASIRTAMFTSTQHSRPSCITVSDIQATRVAAGDLPLSTPPLVSPARVIRNLSEWSAIASRIPAGALPAGYAPDFTAVTLIYLEGSDNDPSSYMRIIQVLRSVDNSVDAAYEYCGNTIVMLPTHLPYALYSVPKTAGTVRLNIQVHAPPNCATTAQ